VLVDVGFTTKDIGVVCWLRVLAVVAGDEHSEHIVFHRCGAPEKIKIVRTEGNTIG